MPWTTLTLEVTTPLFNGGADAGPPDGTGIRASSLRGAMRWWFRALAGTVTGPDLGLLWRLERTVFGGQGARGEDVSSPVRLRVPVQPELTPVAGPHDFLPPPGASRKEREDHVGYWIVYLLGQGLGDLRGCTLHRPYVAPGRTFDLKLRFDDDGPRAALALAALWLTCAYGGAGARVRRGFGGLRVIGSSGPLPAPWDADSIRTPGLEHYTGLRHLWPAGPVSACMPHLLALLEAAEGTPALDAWPEPPPFPVLSRRHTLAGLNGDEPFDDWDWLLNNVGEQFRRFRANEDHPEVSRRYRPPLKTPEWEAVVHGGGSRFPLGALGLPTVYKDGYKVGAWRGAEEQRRASALWLRPVGSPGRLRLLSFAFLGDFLPGPNAPGVQLRGNDRAPRPLQVTSDDVRALAESWVAHLAKPEWEPFPPDSRPAP